MGMPLRELRPRNVSDETIRISVPRCEFRCKQAEPRLTVERLGFFGSCRSGRWLSGVGELELALKSAHHRALGARAINRGVPVARAAPFAHAFNEAVTIARNPPH